VFIPKFLAACQDTLDSFLAWFTTAVKQTTASYCALETADDNYTFAAHDGSLVSIIRVEGTTQLIGHEEFTHLHEKLTQSLQIAMAQPGHTLQVVFHHDPIATSTYLEKLLSRSQQTAQALHLTLGDLLRERIRHLSAYCHYECMYIVLWTNTKHLNREQSKQAEKDKLKLIRAKQLKPFKLTQNVIAAIPLLRNTHDMFIKSVLQELISLNIQAVLLEVHDAASEIRQLADPEFTDGTWRVSLPGDKVSLKAYPKYQENLCDILWPPLARQLLPRDAENLDLRSVRLGDRIYSCVFIDLLPKEIQDFSALLKYTLAANIPWRISFLAESDSLHTLKFKALLATILSFSSKENRLLSNANNLLDYIAVHSDDAIVQLKIVVCTWAPADQMELLRTRTAALARAIQSWGVSDVSEVSGDPFEGLVATLPGMTPHSIATPTLLPCSAMVNLLPLARPASPWLAGAQLFRTPDGKPWPFQPGSSLQITWIDLIYARPGAGKSVLSNTLNLAVCLKAGLKKLPYLAILDIGPSSKGFISLLKEALPPEQQDQVAYYALQMDKRYTINPFDTQLGARYPTHQERSFLVNFLTLLATPLEEDTAYDGIADMAGLIIDELYKKHSDSGKPYPYTPNIEPQIDALLQSLNIEWDLQTTWWEITDNLFKKGYIQEARLAQRQAMPLLADVAYIARLPTVSDLYGKMVTRTGETLINAFSRMISRGMREYPILSGVTQFDLSSARVIALDLEAVTKSGGPAADRQTAVMYMLARYLLTRNSYLNDAFADSVSEDYQAYHRTRVDELRESTKRIVFDEFHRTGKSQIVRDQIISDMREGRKWNIQIALLSQSLDDFDPVMIEFATSVYILDAGSIQTIEKSAKIFGLSPTAKKLLRTQVHGPQESGVTFLAQFSTTAGLHTQLLTLTLGPIELWALNTSVEDVILRDKLYQTLGPTAARALLARIFPNGTARKVIESRLLLAGVTPAANASEAKSTIIEQLYNEILRTGEKPLSKVQKR
jgi:intracellular multiplication protein IcmB